MRSILIALMLTLGLAACTSEPPAKGPAAPTAPAPIPDILVGRISTLYPAMVSRSGATFIVSGGLVSVGGIADFGSAITREAKQAIIASGSSGPFRATQWMIETGPVQPQASWPQPAPAFRRVAVIDIPGAVHVIGDPVALIRSGNEVSLMSEQSGTRLVAARRAAWDAYEAEVKALGLPTEPRPAIGSPNGPSLGAVRPSGV